MMPVLRVDPVACEARDLEPAIAWLRSGGVVAFPTDTLYGLAVDPFSEPAVRDVFDIKGRGSAAALPLIASSTPQVEALFGRLDDDAAALARAFWPGPLSIVLDAPARLARAVHAGAGTVAVRVPASRVARVMAEAFGRPLTATSANRSGERPAARAADLGSLAGDPRLLVVDAGPAPGGVPSTIVDVRGGRRTLVREGAVAWSRVIKSLKK